MSEIIVTGAGGFIGRNLMEWLWRLDGVALNMYDVENDPSDLERWLETTDVIVHLAGVNHPEREEEFDTGNRGFTQQ